MQLENDNCGPGIPAPRGMEHYTMDYPELASAGEDSGNERQVRGAPIAQPHCAQHRWANPAPTVIQCFLIDPSANTRTKVDCRLVNPGIDGKATSTHISDMLTYAVRNEIGQFSAVLLDDWYADQGVMLQCENLGKIYWGAIKGNRLVDTRGGGEYGAVRDAGFDETNALLGLTVWLPGRDGCLRAKIFRTTGPDGRHEYAATNQLFQGTPATTSLMFGRRSRAAALNSTNQLHAIDKPAYWRRECHVCVVPGTGVCPSLRAMPARDGLAPGPYLFFVREGGWNGLT